MTCHVDNVGLAVPCPGNGGRMKVGELVFFGGGRRFRVLDVVPFEDEDESPFVGLLRVEAA
jgi:hypothetical protein